MLPVFVYGTLRHGCCNYNRILAENTLTERPAQLPNTVMFGLGMGFPYVAETEASTHVVGELMDIDPDVYEAVLAQLDQLEGYHPESDHNHYDRVERTVILADGSVTQAWVYLLTDHKRINRFTARAVVTTGDWLEPVAA